MQPSSNG
jgi:hypothetical protein